MAIFNTNKICYGFLGLGFVFSIFQPFKPHFCPYIYEWKCSLVCIWDNKLCWKLKSQMEMLYGESFSRCYGESFKNGPIWVSWPICAAVNPCCCISYLICIIILNLALFFDMYDITLTLLLQTHAAALVTVLRHSSAQKSWAMKW